MGESHISNMLIAQVVESQVDHRLRHQVSWHDDLLLRPRRDNHTPDGFIDVFDQRNGGLISFVTHSPDLTTGKFQSQLPNTGNGRVHHPPVLDVDVPHGQGVNDGDLTKDTGSNFWAMSFHSYKIAFTDIECGSCIFNTW